MAAGQPKPAFYVALALVVLGLIAFAVYRSDVVAPKPALPQGGGGQPQGKLEPKDLGLEQAAESSDSTSPTTVKEYTFKPAEKLPPVKGVAAYKPLEDNTVRFALNVWAGWAPIVLANDGFKAGQEWKTADGKPFKVDLVLIDNPVQMRDAYAAGEVHIGWATLDMVPLFLESFVDPQGNPRTAGSCRGSTSRSTSPTAATASWSARTSRPSPTCGARSSCWPRTRRRITSR